jgi:uncharacterized protein (TIGR03643 family)
MNNIEIDRIIEMAWEDRTSFDAIYKQFNVQEKGVIKIMRSNLKKSSFKLWRKRVSGRKTKHLKVLNNEGIKTLRFKCSRQKNISHNRIT